LRGPEEASSIEEAEKLVMDSITNGDGMVGVLGN